MRNPDNPELRRERNKRYLKAHGGGSRQMRPFVGVDGEGGGTDDVGRQNFLLLRAGELELFNNNQPLGTEQCLDFILALSPRPIYTGFYFTYDATQILRDLPAERLEYLFAERDNEPGQSRYTFWRDYAIEFRPRQFFRVARTTGADRMRVMPGTCRTINEVGGFFQKSFVEAIKDWQIGDAQTVAMIAENKERRAGFTQIDDEIRRYCGAECDLLAELMTAFRAVCADAGIVPRSWRGAGWIAARLHELHKTPRRGRDQVALPPRLEHAAINAYYGGRFEIAATGAIPGPVYEYDINSAYPAAMLELPCPLHTEWRKFTGEPDPSCPYFIARVKFNHSMLLPLCGLPIRRNGRLFWPRAGNGVYWSPELRAAMKLSNETTQLSMIWAGGYIAKLNCSCRSFEWVRELYELRQRIGKSNRGYPIKLGINGLYGKLAQRQGGAPFRDYIAAGLITAIVRAKLIAAYSLDPQAIVMLATDAVYSRRPLPLDLGTGLGQWEETVRPTGMFVVQPGIYWSPGSDIKPKTRGIPRSRIIERRAEFEAAWTRWLHSRGEPPAVSVETTSFIGHRLALHRNKPELAGSWIKQPRRISFDWKHKRDPGVFALDGAMAITQPKPGSASLISESYDPARLTELTEQLLELEAAPDFYTEGNTGE